MEETELLLEVWSILKEYIKDKQQAIDHLISTLVDKGLTDETIEELRGTDKHLDKALEEYVDNDINLEDYNNEDEDW